MYDLASLFNLAALFNLTSSFGLASASAFWSASASVTSSQIIAESCIILTKYFPLSQLHVAVFQTCFRLHDAFYTHIDIYCYSATNLNYICFHQIYIYICMIYALLMFLIHLFMKSCWKILDLEHILYLINHSNYYNF